MSDRVITRRRFITSIGATALGRALPLVAQQQRTQVYGIGFLASDSATAYDGRLEAFRAGLRELGYVEGRNVRIESRWAAGQNDRLSALAEELLRMNVNVLVTSGTPATRAA